LKYTYKKSINLKKIENKIKIKRSGIVRPDKPLVRAHILEPLIVSW
jgi:hypothetical protein